MYGTLCLKHTKISHYRNSSQTVLCHSLGAVHHPSYQLTRNTPSRFPRFPTETSSGPYLACGLEILTPSLSSLFSAFLFFFFLTVTNFIILGSKITADGDCSQGIKRHLLLGRKPTINLDSILKHRDITLPTKVHLVKAMVFPVVTYGCESWTVKKAVMLC